jgi:hypothetical protein
VPLHRATTTAVQMAATVPEITDTSFEANNYVLKKERSNQSFVEYFMPDIESRLIHRLVHTSMWTFWSPVHCSIPLNRFFTRQTLWPLVLLACKAWKPQSPLATASIHAVQCQVRAVLRTRWCPRELLQNRSTRGCARLGPTIGLQSVANSRHRLLIVVAASEISCVARMATVPRLVPPSALPLDKTTLASVGQGPSCQRMTHCISDQFRKSKRVSHF